MSLIAIDKILPNPEQPRVVFDKAELQGLAESIRENGVIEPVVVEEAGKNYILHDGERRVRAARMVGLTEIEASVVPGLNGAGKTDRLMRAMVANLQRADLNPIEEAQAYRRMIDELGMSQMGIARRLGISTARVPQRLKLLELEPEIRKEIAAGRLSKDLRLITALLEIPGSAARVKTARTLAERNTSIKAGIEACQRVTGALSEARIGPTEVPAIRLAVRKAGAVNRPMWDAFAQAGKVPPWLLVEICIRNVCDRCGLRESASATVCRGCALVEMLDELIGKTNTRGVKNGS